jgi:hypothetical protein
VTDLLYIVYSSLESIELVMLIILFSLGISILADDPYPQSDNIVAYPLVETPIIRKSQVEHEKHGQYSEVRH